MRNKSTRQKGKKKLQLHKRTRVRWKVQKKEETKKGRGRRDSFHASENDTENDSEETESNILDDQVSL